MVPLVIQDVASDRTDILNDHRDILLLSISREDAFRYIRRTNAPCVRSHRPRANQLARAPRKRGNDRAIEYHDDFVLVFYSVRLKGLCVSEIFFSFSFLCLFFFLVDSDIAFLWRRYVAVLPSYHIKDTIDLPMRRDQRDLCIPIYESKQAISK